MHDCISVCSFVLKPCSQVSDCKIHTHVEEETCDALLPVGKCTLFTAYLFIVHYSWWRWTENMLQRRDYNARACISHTDFILKWMLDIPSLLLWQCWWCAEREIFDCFYEKSKGACKCLCCRFYMEHHRACSWFQTWCVPIPWYVLPCV